MFTTRRPRVLYLVLLFAISGNFASAETQSRIVGGTPVPPGNYPWMAAIVDANNTDTSRGQFCGGSLIDGSYVLTAAHCVADERGNPINLQAEPIDVLLGTVMLGDGSGERIGVEKLAIHPNADIALLKLKHKAKIDPIELLTPGSNYASPGTTATVIGWGLTRENGQASDRLLQTSIPVVSAAVCKRAYPNMNPNFEICAGLARGGKDSCQGDSGGPLFVTGQNNNRLVQAGVVSYGDGCARPGFPGVYASVSSAANWIETTTANGGDSDDGDGDGSGDGDENILKADFDVSCDGLQCTFDGRKSTAGHGQIEEYVWEIGRNVWKYGRRIQHTYRQNGNKEATLYAVQTDGAVDYKTSSFSVTDSGDSGNPGLVTQRWNGGVRAERRVVVPGKDGINVPAGPLQITLVHGPRSDFDLIVQKMNENTGRWQTIRHAATEGVRETIRIRQSPAGQYRFIVQSSRGSGPFRIVARHR